MVRVWRVVVSKSNDCPLAKLIAPPSLVISNRLPISLFFQIEKERVSPLSSLAITVPIIVASSTSSLTVKNRFSAVGCRFGVFMLSSSPQEIHKSMIRNKMFDFFS